MDWNAVKPLLDAKLDPKHVRKPTGNYGPKGDYVEGWHAIAEANRIFGPGAWSYRIKELTQDSLKEGTDSKGNVQWQAAYTCIVTLDVAGTVREDVGFGSGFAKQIGDAIEGATKEAVTDALKRALRTFGNPFGLALYDKARANVGVDVNPRELADRIEKAIAGAKDVAALDRLWKHPQTNDAFAKLDDDLRGFLTQKYTARVAYLGQAPNGHNAGGFDA